MDLPQDLHDIQGKTPWYARKQNVELGHKIYALWLAATEGKTKAPLAVRTMLRNQLRNTESRVRGASDSLRKQRADTENNLKKAERAGDREAVLAAYKLIDEINERIALHILEVERARREEGLYSGILNHILNARKARGLPMEGKPRGRKITIS
jgi:hypothetical protein